MQIMLFFEFLSFKITELLPFVFPSDARFGYKLGHIGPTWDKLIFLRSVQVCFSEPECTEIGFGKVMDFAHLGQMCEESWSMSRGVGKRFKPIVDLIDTI